MPFDPTSGTGPLGPLGIQVVSLGGGAYVKTIDVVFLVAAVLLPIVLAKKSKGLSVVAFIAFAMLFLASIGAFGTQYSLFQLTGGQWY